MTLLHSYNPYNSVLGWKAKDKLMLVHPYKLLPFQPLEDENASYLIIS